MVASNEAGVIDAARAPLAARQPAVASAEEMNVRIVPSESTLIC
jgi:hypothetical protein